MPSKPHYATKPCVDVELQPDETDRRENVEAPSLTDCSAPSTKVPSDQHWLTTRTVLALLSLTSLYVATASTLVMPTVIGSINAAIGPVAGYTWMASGYLLANAISGTLAGILGDLFGRRWIMISAAVLIATGAVVSATAHTVNTVIAGCTVTGFGAGIGANGQAAIAELVPINIRATVLAGVNVLCFPYAALGSLVGHTMVERTSPGWRSVFWLNFSHAIFGLILLICFYHPQEPIATAGKSRWGLVKTFDYVGLLGIIIGPTLILLGITWVNSYSATDAHFLAPLLLGCATLIALGFHQVYLAKNSLLQPYLFRRWRTFTMLTLVTFVGGLLFYSLLSFLSTYLSLVFDGSHAIAIGVHSIPSGIGTIVGGIGGAVVLLFTQRTRLLLVVGAAIQLIFVGLMALPDIDNLKMALAFSGIAGFGIGWSELLCIILVQIATPPEYIGYATGLLALSRTAAGSAGTAMYGAILESRAKVELLTQVPAAAVGAGLPQTSLPQLIGILTGAIRGNPMTVPGVTPEILGVAVQATRSAYRDAFQYIWYASIPFGVLAVVASALTKNISSKDTRVVQHVAEHPIKADTDTKAEAI